MSILIDDFDEYIKNKGGRSLGDFAKEISFQLRTNGPYANQIRPYLEKEMDMGDKNVDPRFWVQTMMYLNAHDGVGWWQSWQWDK